MLITSFHNVFSFFDSSNIFFILSFELLYSFITHSTCSHNSSIYFPHNCCLSIFQLNKYDIISGLLWIKFLNANNFAFLVNLSSKALKLFNKDSSFNILPFSSFIRLSNSSLPQICFSLIVKLFFIFFTLKKPFPIKFLDISSTLLCVNTPFSKYLDLLINSSNFSIYSFSKVIFSFSWTNSLTLSLIMSLYFNLTGKLYLSLLSIIPLKIS